MNPYITEVTASGAVKATGGYVFMVSLTAGSDAATLELRNGGAAGTIVLTLKAGAGASVVAPIPRGALLSTGIYMTLAAGTAPRASVVWW